MVSAEEKRTLFP